MQLLVWSELFVLLASCLPCGCCILRRLTVFQCYISAIMHEVNNSLTMFTSWDSRAAGTGFLLNRHLPGGLVHSYQLDELISNFRGAWCTFPFLSYFFDRNSRQLTVETQIRRRVLRRLIWVCTVYLCPKNGTLCLYGLKVLKTGQTLFMRCQAAPE